MLKTTTDESRLCMPNYSRTTSDNTKMFMYTPFNNYTTMMGKVT